MPFCVACGQSNSDAVRFCTSCGVQVAPSAAAAPTPSTTPPPVSVQSPVPPWQAPEGTSAEFGPAAAAPKKGRGVMVLLIAVAAVVVVVAGIFGGRMLLAGLTGGGGGTSSSWNGGTQPLGSAVTSEPEEVWSWSGADYEASVMAAGDRTIVSYFTDDGAALVALDSDGEEEWQIEPDHTDRLAMVAPEEELALLGPYEEGTGIEARSTKDGSLEWWEADLYPVAVTSEGVLGADSDGGIALLDFAGKERWSDSSDRYQIVDDAVYLLDGTEVRKVDLGSGDEKWSVDSDLDIAVDYDSLEMAASEQIVVLAGDGSAVAFAASDGEELWTEDYYPDEYSLSGVGRELVAIEELGDSEESIAGEITFYDADGERGDIDVDSEEYFYARAFEFGGDSYILDDGSGRIYDDQLEELGRFDGYLTPADGGIYGVEDDELSFYEIDQNQAVWSIDIGSSDEGFSLVPVDDAVIVVSEGQVTRYE